MIVLQDFLQAKFILKEEKKVCRTELPPTAVIVLPTLSSFFEQMGLKNTGSTISDHKAYMRKCNYVSAPPFFPFRCCNSSDGTEIIESIGLRSLLLFYAKFMSIPPFIVCYVL